jgi:glutamate synthase domain-containing protein 2
MKIHLLSCLLLVAAGNLAQAAECVYPREPKNTPNGLTATNDEMVAGMKLVKEYNAKVTEYLACLDTQMQEALTSAGPDATAEAVGKIKSINAQRHNAAIEALESHAARFNEEVRAFKTRDKDKS